MPPQIVAGENIMCKAKDCTLTPAVAVDLNVMPDVDKKERRPHLSRPTLESCQRAGAQQNLRWESFGKIPLPRSVRQRTKGWVCNTCGNELFEPLSLMQLRRIFPPKEGYCPCCFPKQGERRSGWDNSQAMFQAINDRRFLTWLGLGDGNKKKPPRTHDRTEWQCNVCTHKFWATLANVLMVSGCPRCGLGTVTKDDYDRLGEAARITLNQSPPPLNVSEPAQWTCAHDSTHEFIQSYEVVLAQLKGGYQICPHCPSQKRGPIISWLSPEDYRGLEGKLNCRCDGPFPAASDERTNWYCQNGHLIVASYREMCRKIERGYQICLHCAGLIRSDPEPIKISLAQETTRALIERTKAEVEEKVQCRDLDKRERLVVTLRFALFGHRVQTLGEIAPLLGFRSGEGVRQIQESAIKKLGLPRQVVKTLLPNLRTNKKKPAQG